MHEYHTPARQHNSKTSHAEENLDFYFAVKQFEKSFDMTMLAAASGERPGIKQTTSSNRMFGSMYNLKAKPPAEGQEEPAASAPPGQGKRVLGMSKVFGSMIQMTGPKKASPLESANSLRKLEESMEGNLANKMGLTTSDVKVLNASSQIYREFLTDKSDRWVCMDEHVSGVILKRIESGAVDRNLFDVAMKMVFDNMEKDLVPRFNKSFHAFGDMAPINAESIRGSVRFSPRVDHKKHFDQIIGAASPNGQEVPTAISSEASPAPPKAATPTPVATFVELTPSGDTKAAVAETVVAEAPES